MNIIKKTLKNGLVLLCIPSKISSKVSLQLFYKVGSKYEETGFRGIAHLIEHMIFKGTDNLPEGELDNIVYKLSGSCNAFTSQDYTGYVFDVPSQHYKQILPLMADCMTNCSFDQQHLNSELKTVIQELKMYKDDHLSSLLQSIMAAMFPGHGYHDPIIGYKSDIWSMKTEDLKAFYSKYYMPKNAVLVVAGEIDPEECFFEVNKVFGEIKNQDMNEILNYHERDLVSRNIVLHRDVQQKHVFMAWEVPGISTESWYVYDLLVVMLGSGKGSRLYQKLVYKEQFVYDIDVFVRDMFDHSILCIYFKPKDGIDSALVIQSVIDELKLIALNSFTIQEYERAVRRTKMALVSLEEDSYRAAYIVGRLYCATGDENVIVSADKIEKEEALLRIKELLDEYIRPACMQIGSIVPAEKEDVIFWQKLQAEKDAIDSSVLESIVREDVYEKKIVNYPIDRLNPQRIQSPLFEKKEYPNGMVVYCIPIESSSKIECCVDFKAKHYYDPEMYSGRMGVLFDVMEEGTLLYPDNNFSNTLENLGMEFESGAGSISLAMLPDDIEKGCELLAQYILYPELKQNALERVKEQTLSDIIDFWDDPESSAKQLLREAVYKGHPYGKNPAGKIESINKIDLDALKDAYNKYISPYQTVFVWAGKIESKQVYDLMDKYFSKWSGNIISDVLSELPAEIQESGLIFHPMSRDQTVLVFGGLTVSRMDKLYDLFLIYDQIFGGGVLGSARSRLFSLRERTGKFYTIGGTLIAGCARHPGMIYIKAITSPAFIEDAICEIEKVINTALESITDSEILDAQHALANEMTDIYSTARNCASTFIFMHRYNLSINYFQDRIDALYLYKKTDIQDAIRAYLNSNKMIKLLVGRC